MALPVNSPLGPGLYPRQVNTPSTPIKTVIKNVSTAPPQPAPPPPPKPNPVVPDVLPRIYQFPKETLVYNVTGVSKYDQVATEKAAANFVRNEPEILMVTEYIVNEKTLGVLVVIKKYQNATHYELFKQNLFQENARFERVLFLDEKSLKEETDRYSSYLSNYIGMKLDFNKHYIIFDPLIKDDRIYEYKIRASRVPAKITEVDFDFIIESKKVGAFREIDKTVKTTLFDYAATTLGSRDLAWVISLLNETVPFFGRGPAQTNLASLSSKILFASNTNSILDIAKDCFSLFGEKATLEHMIRILGGLGADFINSYVTSINETSKTFSYSTFISSIRSKIPVYNLILKVSESKNNTDALKRLSTMSITIPNKTGTESYQSIEGLTRIFNFINGIYLSVIYSQEGNNANEIKAIVDALNAPPPAPAPAPLVPLNNTAQNRPVLTLPTPAKIPAPAPVTTTNRAVSTVNQLINNTLLPSKSPIIKLR